MAQLIATCEQSGNAGALDECKVHRSGPQPETVQGRREIMRLLARCRTSKWLYASVFSTVLAACGSDNTASVATNTLGGVAAVGAPIVGGVIKVVCAGGGPLTATTDSAGAWQVTTSGQTLPCAVELSGGTVNGISNPLKYHSATLSFGTLNVTPLTDLVVANLVGAVPSTWFSGIGSTSWAAVTSAALDSARSSVFTALGIVATLNGGDPLTATFSATNGNLYDDILRALAAAGDASGTDYSTFLTLATSRSFVAPSGFNFSAAYASATGSGGGGGTAGSCAGGGVNLTYNGPAVGPYHPGDVVCFVASPTALSFSGKTLGSPVQNTGVTPPYTDYTFTDASTGLGYEVVFNAGAVQELNVMDGTNFKGQFGAATVGTGTVTATLTVEVTVSGIAAPAVVISNVTKPGSQADFCGAIQSDSSLTALTAGGGTLTITSCTFSGSVGTITANLVITTPVNLTTSYSVKYTYS